MAHGAIEWIEIPATDLVKSLNFYQAVFGWRTSRASGVDEYLMFMDSAGGLRGGFSTTARPMAEPGVMLFVTVDDIDAVRSAIIGNGGRMVMEKTEVTREIGWRATFQDPAGNLVGLFQRGRGR